jgi:translation initiation factor 2-alpha kinase 4
LKASSATQTTRTPWKTVTAVHEFTVRVDPLEDDLKDAVSLTLHFKLPASYPRVPPTLTLEAPKGLLPEVIAALETQLRKAAASKDLLGSEMCFELCSTASTYITEHHSVVRGQASLSHEVDKRTEADKREEEVKRRAQLEAERQRQEQERVRLAGLLEADTRDRKVRVAEAPKTPSKARNESATAGDVEVPTVVFEEGFETGDRVRSRMVVQGAQAEQRAYTIIVFAWNTLNARTDSLMTIHHAEALSLADPPTRTAVALHLVELPRAHFVSPAVKRKVFKVIDDARRVSVVRSAGLQRLFAAQLSDDDRELRIEIVTEPLPTASLDFLLAMCGPLAEDRALACLSQIATGLAELHAAGLTHNGARCRRCPSREIVDTRA